MIPSYTSTTSIQPRTSTDLSAGPTASTHILFCENPAAVAERMVGVTFDKRRRRFEARARVAAQQYFLGYYHDALQAAGARQRFLNQVAAGTPAADAAKGVQAYARSLGRYERSQTISSLPSLSTAAGSTLPVDSLMAPTTTTGIAQLESHSMLGSDVGGSGMAVPGLAASFSGSSMGTNTPGSHSFGPGSHWPASAPPMLGPRKFDLTQTYPTFLSGSRSCTSNDSPAGSGFFRVDAAHMLDRIHPAMDSASRAAASPVPP